MIAYAHRTSTAVPLTPMAPLSTPAGADAGALALGFLRYASACWRGDETARRFATRLGAYWRPQLPPMPTTPPRAFSPHGAGGRGIAWYQTGSEVLGYIPESHYGYVVPIAAIPGLVRCAPAGPCATQEVAAGKRMELTGGSSAHSAAA